jgi:hypothetical protein
MTKPAIAGGWLTEFHSLETTRHDWCGRWQVRT